MLSRSILTDIKVFFITQSLILVPYSTRNIEGFLDNAYAWGKKGLQVHYFRLRGPVFGMRAFAEFQCVTLNFPGQRGNKNREIELEACSASRVF